MTPAVSIATGLGVAAVVEDRRRRSVPNRLSAAGAAGGLAGAAWGGRHGLGIAAAGTPVGLPILPPFYWCGAVGGGDVQRPAGYGALPGPSGILPAAAFAAFFGGLPVAGRRLRNPRTPAVRYAPAIVLGAWASLLGGGS